MKKVIFEKDGRIGRITLNRPEKLNAIDDEFQANCKMLSMKQRMTVTFT